MSMPEPARTAWAQSPSVVREKGELQKTGGMRSPGGEDAEEKNGRRGSFL